MNLILPIILILSSLGVFFGYIDPNYKGTGASGSADYSTYGIVALQQELAKFQNIADSAKSIVAERDNLVQKQDTIPTADQDRLARLLPSTIDNIRLILEINQIAANRGLVAKNISIGSTNANTTAAGTAAAGATPYGTLPLSFTVTASYTDFLSLLSDLENNLRLIDITGISFTSNNTGFYDFTVNLNTYWLK